MDLTTVCNYPKRRAGYCSDDDFVWYGLLDVGSRRSHLLSRCTNGKGTAGFRRELYLLDRWSESCSSSESNSVTRWSTDPNLFHTRRKGLSRDKSAILRSVSHPQGFRARCWVAPFFLIYSRILINGDDDHFLRTALSRKITCAKVYDWKNKNDNCRIRTCAGNAQQISSLSP